MLYLCYISKTCVSYFSKCILRQVKYIVFLIRNISLWRVKSLVKTGTVPKYYEQESRSPESRTSQASFLIFQLTTLECNLKN